MYIAGYICLGLGIILIILSVVLFFKDNVKEAFLFVTRKKAGKPVAASKSKPRKQRNSSYKKAKASTGKKATHGPKPNVFEARQADDEPTTNIDTGELETETLSDDSEAPTGMLSEESEQPTGMLQEDSESPTGILQEDSEAPTGMLQEDSESPTGILKEDSEAPTSMLQEESEAPTGMLQEDSEAPTGILKDASSVVRRDSSKVSKPSNVADKDNAKSETPIVDDFYFKIIEDHIEIHTEEIII